MTREEAKKAAEVMLAYAEGKEIEFKSYTQDWDDILYPNFNWDRNKYRIKPSPKYRPFESAEECWNEMLKHQPFGWVKGKTDEVYLSIGYVTATDEEDEPPLIYINEDGSLERSSDQMFNHFTFADGTPFGVKEGGEE